MIYIALRNSPEQTGGVEQVVNNLLKNFDPTKKGEIEIIYSYSEKNLHTNEYKGYRCHGVKIRDYGKLDKVFWISKLTYSYKLMYYLKQRLKSDSRIIANIHGLEYAFFPSIFLSKEKNIRTIVTVHGSYYKQYNDFIVKRLPIKKYAAIKAFFFFWKYLFWIIEKISLSGISECVFITKSTQEYFQRIYKYNGTSVIIKNGGALKAHSFKNHSQDSRYELTGLIVGSNVILKGLDIAIKSVEKYNKNERRKINLNIVGFKDYRKYYKHDLANIKYIGPVLPQDMRAHYENADFFILPSRFEEFPLVILEALSFGLPIITSKACNSNEINNFEQAGIIVNSYDIDDWVYNIRKLEENLTSYSKNCTSMNLDEYDWRHISAQYLNLYYDRTK